MVFSLAFFGVGAYLGAVAAQQLRDYVPIIKGPDILARAISQRAGQLIRRNPKP